MVKALIGLGANLGNPAENLDAAKSRLEKLESTELLATSDWYSTAPIGGPEHQSEFLNGAALLETSLSPESLVVELQGIESTLGRERIVRWGPRLIDLDIVLYGDRIVDLPTLKIPHPWMALRRFVLEPAAQIASELMHPSFGWSVGQLFENLHNRGRIEITSVSSVDTRSIVDWLVQQTYGEASSYVEPDRTFSSVLYGAMLYGAIPTFEKLMGWCDAWSEHLRKRVHQDEHAESIISDRWCEELLVAGAVYLDKSDFGHLKKAWEDRFEEDAQNRKLLVILQDPTRAQDENEIAAEFWKRVHRPGHGPWLILDASDPERMRHDLLAVVTGMR